MRNLLFSLLSIPLILLLGCAGENSSETSASDEDYLKKEVPRELYEDTVQMKEIIEQAYNEDRRLNRDEEILYDQFNSKYDDYESTRFYEGELTSAPRHLNNLLRSYLHDDPVLDSEDSHRTKFRRALHQLNELLDEVETY
ncbi:hypothetical protein HXA31_09410 [Salipaludibacillus agaradhaerens]|jgi:hypothetical protein|uniref:Uncharacterized protein n=1 Tax=Salipaludibacillus agaradhaerens TaxID=76935 RepID=A0A9Q4FVV6_SALAG|nr:hypothetical protein [Salipaludibacillus agaradhaerens]MCR6095850.1 hypothetical protein [Salipaludibacillus agaradhaerens]MCR6114590.1 hypothetical protein [Salipaludibacillus agaradhaerens]